VYNSYSTKNKQASKQVSCAVLMGAADTCFKHNAADALLCLHTNHYMPRYISMLLKKRTFKRYSFHNHGIHTTGMP
jgi:hypothetical protein